MEAQFAHIDNVLLKTVPTTAAGCVALARYAIDFLEADGWVLDENEAANQHVRILELIARSPMLGSEPQGRPFVPDFSGYSAKDLMRTYNAFKLATDIMGLTGWTISAEGVGHRLLDAEGDRLSFFQGYIADELRRRDLSDRTEASWRTDTVINRTVTREVWRDAREGERPWHGQGSKLPEIQPWSEAQARAAELVAIWDAGQAEQRRIEAEHGLPAALAISEAATQATKAITAQIAATPAHTAEGLKVKIRALDFYTYSSAKDEPDAILMRSLVRNASANEG